MLLSSSNSKKLELIDISEKEKFGVSFEFEMSM